MALCRDVKERCLSDSSVPVFTVSIPGRGSSLLGRTLSAQIDRAEIESIVLEGFFPECNFDDQPARTQAGLREWALPYAVDSAVTRYLAEFLRGRPGVDAILFNGGSLYPEALRQRLQKQIARWQHGAEPRILENLEPNLAVARGAAHFGRIVHRRAQRIEAGAARALYLEVHKGDSANEIGQRPFADLHSAQRRPGGRSFPSLSRGSRTSCQSPGPISALLFDPAGQEIRQDLSCPGTIATSIVSRRSRQPPGLPVRTGRVTACR